MKFYRSFLLAFGLSLLSLSAAHAGRDVLYVPGADLTQFNQVIDTYIRLYDANTGAVLADKLILNPSGLGSMAVTGGKLYLLNINNGVVSVYDAVSGALINGNLITVANQASAITAWGSHLFIINNIATQGSARVSEYTADGQIVNANLVTGLYSPLGVAVSDTNIFVTDIGTHTVCKYPRTGGSGTNSFISGLKNPNSVTIVGDKIFFTDNVGQQIYSYTTSGQFIASWPVTPHAAGGGGFPRDIVVVGSHVLVADEDASAVHEYSLTGDYLNLSFITGERQVSYLALANVDLPGAITSFSVTGPNAPMAPIHLAATSSPSIKVRVQASTTPDNDGSWINLADGGVMTEQPAGSGNYVLDTTFYPAGSGIYFRAVSNPPRYADIPSAKPYPGPFNLHPPTGPQPMTFTAVENPTRVLSFAADQVATAAGLSVKVQYSTPTVDWTELPNDNHGVLIIDKSATERRYVLNTYNYPALDQVKFRAIATAQGYPSTTSNEVGPFDLSSPTEHLGPTNLYFRANGPVANLRFGAHEATIPSGTHLRIQTTNTPGDENSWQDVQDGQMAVDSNHPNEFYLGLDSYPVGQNIYFRAAADASGYLTSVSHPVGPVTVIYDPGASIQMTVGNFDVGTGENYDNPAEVSSGSFKVTAQATSTRNITHLALKYDGDTIESFTSAAESGNSFTFTTNVGGDHIVEAVATDDIGVVGDALPVHVRVAPNAPGRLLYITQAGDWSDPSIWIKANGSPAGSSPGPGDFAVLSNVDVTISAPITVEALSLNGATISGSGKLTVTGLCTMGAGRILSDMEIADGATCLLINDSDVTLGGNFTNAGRLKLHGLGGITGIPNQHGMTSALGRSSISPIPNGFFDGLVAFVKNIGQMIFHRPAGGRNGSGSPKSSVPAAVQPEVRPVAANISNQGQVKVVDDSVALKIPAPVISPDGGRLIGQDGNGIVAQGGGNAVAAGDSLMGQDGNGLTAQDGSGLIGQDGNGLIGQDGNGIVAQGGGNFVGHNGAAVTAGGPGAAGRPSVSAETVTSGYVQSSGTTDLTGLTIEAPVILDGGVLAGSGLINGDLTNNAGYIAPGNSAGLIAVAGNFAQGSSGTLILESGGPRPNQFDQLSVGGSAQLGGKLDLKTINGYAPITTDDFSPLSYGSISGSFASVSMNASVTATSAGLLITDDVSKPQPVAGQPANISTRMKVLTDDKVLIGGFIITGPNGSTKKVLIRGMGPTLGRFGVPGALSDPLIQLNYPDSSVLSNDDWQQAANHDQIPQDFQPDAKESALLVDLPPGAYTVIEKGAHGETGIGLTEVYDFDGSTTVALANISTRGFVDTGDNVMIGGFIVGGSEPGKILVRGTGPTLKNYGLTGVLEDPMLELHDANGNIVGNDDWRETQESEIIATTIPPSDNHEPAILATLVPGSYTAILRGKDNTTGIAIVEAYKVD